MAYIEKRNAKYGIRYRANVRVKGFPSKSATFHSKAEARRWAEAEEGKLKYQRAIEGHNSTYHTLDDAIVRYMRDIAIRTPKSFDAKRFALGVWSRLIGPLQIQKVTAVMISEIRTNMHRGRLGRELAPATVNRYMACLSHVLTIAAREWGWIPASPMSAVTKLKEPRGRVRFLSDNERKRLLDACKLSCNSQMYAIVVVAISTGMRKSEILGLRRSDVDLDRHRIILQDTKNGDRRSVPLVGLAATLVGELWDRDQDSEFLFASPTGGRFFDLKRPWKNALRQAQIFDFRFHDLRHCAASYLAMSGATSHEIAEVLGHKSLDMVKRYTHLCDTHVSKVVERMTKQIF